MNDNEEIYGTQVKQQKRRNSIAIQVYMRKEKENQQPKRTFKYLDNQQQRNPNPSRRKETIKIRTEVNNLESMKRIQRIDENRSCF